jgi:hypothetical protein
MRMKHPTMNATHLKQQSGAALVVALILLVALSLMAISSMNTASLDLIMAGNEQYRNRAFSAAEAGVERALTGGTFSSGADSSAASSTGAGNDTYAYTITRPNSGATVPAPSGYSSASGQFGAIYFRITSNGNSERGTRSQVMQELYEVVKSSDGLNHDDDCGNTNLDGTISSC